jgi:hypothetical protein
MTQDEKIVILRAALEQAERTAKRLAETAHRPTNAWLKELATECERALDRAGF